MSNTIWSDDEQKIAKKALDQACDREIKSLIEEVKLRAPLLQEIEELWQIHDLLSARRYQIEGKYDDRPSALPFVLAQLLKERLTSMNELEGLSQDKLAKISALSRM